MTSDIVATWGTRSLATMIFTMKDKQVLDFHKEGFQLPVPIQFWEMIENAKIVCFLKQVSMIKGY